jgi:hypothetical protein
MCNDGNGERYLRPFSPSPFRFPVRVENFPLPAAEIGNASHTSGDTNLASDIPLFCYHGRERELNAPELVICWELAISGGIGTSPCLEVPQTAFCHDAWPDFSLVVFGPSREAGQGLAKIFGWI